MYGHRQCSFLSSSLLSRFPQKSLMVKGHCLLRCRYGGFSSFSSYHDLLFIFCDFFPSLIQHGLPEENPLDRLHILTYVFRSACILFVYSFIFSLTSSSEIRCWLLRLMRSFSSNLLAVLSDTSFIVERVSTKKRERRGKDLMFRERIEMGRVTSILRMSCFKLSYLFCLGLNQTFSSRKALL